MRRPPVPNLAADHAERTISHQHEMPAPGSLIGSIIAGRYKLRQEIGEGGMGSVYFAEQTQPVKRQVALEADQAGHGLEGRAGPVRVGASGRWR